MASSHNTCKSSCLSRLGSNDLEVSTEARNQIRDALRTRHMRRQDTRRQQELQHSRFSFCGQHQQQQQQCFVPDGKVESFTFGPTTNTVATATTGPAQQQQQQQQRSLECSYYHNNNNNNQYFYQAVPSTSSLELCSEVAADLGLNTADSRIMEYLLQVEKEIEEEQLFAAYEASYGVSIASVGANNNNNSAGNRNGGCAENRAFLPSPGAPSTMTTTTIGVQQQQAAASTRPATSTGSFVPTPAVGTTTTGCWGMRREGGVASAPDSDWEEYYRYLSS